MSWIYNGVDIAECDIPEKAIAFLYKITHIETGKWYIGRKALLKTTWRQIKGKKKKVMVTSDWSTYWSSSDILKEWAITDGEIGRAHV